MATTNLEPSADLVGFLVAGLQNLLGAKVHDHGSYLHYVYQELTGGAAQRWSEDHEDEHNDEKSRHSAALESINAISI